MKVQLDQDRQIRYFADWLMDTTEGAKRLVPEAEIAEQIKSIRKRFNSRYAKERVHAGHVYSWITRARIVLEQENGLTLWNVWGTGYRVATPQETAIFAMRRLKSVVTQARRVSNLVEMVEPKYLPEAFRQVFYHAAKGLEDVRSKAKRFMVTWQQETQKKLNKGETNVQPRR